MSGEVANGETASQQPVRSYRDLEVWRIGVELTVTVYQVSRQLPDDERFGMISQMRRCAASIPANIAEGHGRESTQDFIRFLRMAQGSLKELETHLIVCHRLEFIGDHDLGPILDETDRLGRMTRGLIRSLQERTR
ncbi:MAG: four helix bundle protein [Phycisphaerales bacterium]